jgi:hypothetical protein
MVRARGRERVAELRVPGRVLLDGRLEEVIPGLAPRRLDYSAAEARELMRAAGVTRLPAPELGEHLVRAALGTVSGVSLPPLRRAAPPA